MQMQWLGHFSEQAPHPSQSALSLMSIIPVHFFVGIRVFCLPLSLGFVALFYQLFETTLSCYLLPVSKSVRFLPMKAR